MRKIRKSRGFTLVELMIVVAIIGILAALAIFGVKKYVTNSKTAEARNTIGQVAKDAAGAWSRDLMAGAVLADGISVTGANVLCDTATPVPAAPPKGAKYQSSTAAGVDFNSGTSLVGWVCLRFQMDGPQYFQYNYTSDKSSKYAAIANGDLNGDGTLFSTFELDGVVRNGQIVMSPAIIETNPDE